MRSTVPPAAAGDKYGSITTFAMTTAFTPPASCSSSWTFEPSEANGVAEGLLLQNAVASGTDPACFPSGWNHYGRATADLVFSPGYCPVGYTSAYIGVQASTTTAVCCLSDYGYITLTTDNGNAVFAGCTSMFPSSSSTTVNVRERPGKNTEITGTITMWAQPITVELQASDSSLFVSSTTLPGTSTASTSTDAQPTSTISQPTSTISQSTSTTSQASETTGSSAVSVSSADSVSSGLSTGAGIGVGVGVGVGGIAVFAALGLWLFRRHRKNKKSPPPTYQWPQSYIIAPERVKQEYPSELSTNRARNPIIHELCS